ncbi:Endonuclease/exonuclease/phosphatase domain-containing protein [Rozella allomycis CSF55]|uniref:Endonuclease/exonuclease/phosphatase domain-containing protein n=1 Tax=Rozella allomycis (strain CSF55) TaxID=988480 RepID=A0A075AYM5_ROZAC|nr:Endonuclease/exonuclease/phosphatase domain-containing protein [Rozella allomycis CSF55]|eukprot:EPZ33624.1 Endonuclease/exonuclease/phosphatase domain-containing protein [Rozella allomycis CSF55]
MLNIIQRTILILITNNEDENSVEHILDDNLVLSVAASQDPILLKIQDKIKKSIIEWKSKEDLNLFLQTSKSLINNNESSEVNIPNPDPIFSVEGNQRTSTPLAEEKKIRQSESDNDLSKKSNPFIPVSNATFDITKDEKDLFLKLIKDGYVTRELKEMEQEFTSKRNAKILIGTWNVNGKPPLGESLGPWLRQSTEPDLVILGFQELDLSAEAFLLKESARESEWTAAVDEGLKSTYRSRYRRVASKILVGMLLLIFSKMEHVSSINDIVYSSIGCGILGMMGNKGAVGIRLRFYDSYLCFVNSHLAAGTEQVARRNQDFSDISKKMMFTLPIQGSSIYSQQYYNRWLSNISTNEVIANGNNVDYSIYTCDILFWMGDLNYRIALGDVQVKAMIEYN